MAKIGMLFQGGALFDSLPIWENITFRLLNREKISRAKAKEVAAESLAEVGLGRDVLPLSPSELSGGMQKRVALARAIAAKPEIIFFDEPTTGLDPIMSDVINDLIVKSSKKLGATTIAITHDMASVRKIADKVAMIHKGKIVWFGSVNDIDKTDNEYVVQFINGRAEGPIQMDLKK
jgi:phospholipid/cholesterol/gamma-HCH transport system ATP-binding protein